MNLAGKIILIFLPFGRIHLYFGLNNCKKNRSIFILILFIQALNNFMQKYMSTLNIQFY